MEYFNETNQYKEPTLIKFEQPKTLLLKDLRSFLDAYKPFACSDAYAYGVIEYGDFDNYMRVIYEDVSIDVGFSTLFKEDSGIYKKGQYSITTVSHFWAYRENYPFWKDALIKGYESFHKPTNSLEDVEIKISGVYVISWNDKEKLEKIAK